VLDQSARAMEIVGAVRVCVQLFRLDGKGEGFS